MQEVIISFDFDGTLFLSNQIKKNTFFEIVKEIKNGSDLMSLILKDKNLNRYQIFDILSKELVTNYNIKLCAQKFAEDYSSICHKKILEESKEREGKEKLFKFLKTIKAKKYLISATPYKELVKITNDLKISNDFIKIYGSPTSKESALSEIKKSNSVLGNKIIHIGDGIDDYYSARQTDCNFIGIGGNGLENIKGLELIEDLKEIITIIKKS